jgi:rhomboid protease GluP
MNKNRNPIMKITFNSPFILWFAFISIALLGLQMIAGAPLRITVLDGVFHYKNWQDYVSMVGYIFGHKDFTHYLGNFSIILLIGPSLEKTLGTQTLAIYTLITTVVTAIFHILFWDAGLLGASGIVFMMIVLTSLIGRKNNEIPLTFIIVFVLFVGQEFVKAFQDDQISQFAHICGGAMGMVLGYARK